MRHPGAGWRWLAIAAVLAAAAPVFVRGGDTLTSGAEALLLLLAAIGLNLAMGYVGQPSLGQGGFVAVGAYVTAILVAREGWDPASSILVGVAASSVAGVLVARGVSRLRPAFVAVATWLFAWVTAFAIAAFPSLTGGSRGVAIGQTRLDLDALGLAWRPGPVAFYEIALAGVLAALVIGAALLRRYGAAFAAVRADPIAARAAGIGVERIRIGALTSSAAVGGLAGGLLALNAGVADPTSYGPLLSVKLFVVVLLGGAARLVGPAVGLVAVLAISKLGAGFASAVGGAQPDVEPFAAAAVLAGVLAFGTRGLVPMAERLLRGEPTPRPRTTASPGVPRGADGAGLRARGIRVPFGGVVALDELSLDVSPRTCHVIVGPNGSGKTTLLRVIAGAIAPERGEVSLDGEALTRPDPVARARAGIGRTLQRTAVPPETTAFEYVLAGVEPVRRTGPIRAAFRTPSARLDEREAHTRAHEALSATGLQHLARTPTELLTGAEQRLLQIARALAPGPRVLLLDEPSAGLDMEAETRLRALIAALRRAGITVVVVEHNLRLVRAVADRVSVLDAGRLIAEGTVEEVAADPAVQAAYLGEGADTMGARDVQRTSAPAKRRPRARRV